MKWHSIQTKIFLTFLAVILLIISLTVLLNASLFKSYSLATDKKLMLEYFEEIKERVDKGELTETFLVEKSEETGIQATLHDYPELRTIATSARGTRMSTHMRNITYNHDQLGFIERDNNRGGTLIYVDLISDKLIVSMYKPFALTDRNVRVSNHFLVLVGLGLGLLGAIVLYFLVTRTVRPILYLQKQTKRMAELDFSDRFKAKGFDEISELGRNVNAISDKLSTTIDTLQSDLSKLTEIDKVRKEFMATVSHEFKTPLGIIKGYTESLKYNLVDPKDEETYYETIIEETDRMAELVQDLILVMQRELGQLKLKLDQVKLLELVHFCVVRFQKIDPKRSFEVEGVDVTVEGDERALTQVLDNYLINAEVHGYEDTPIVVRLEDRGESAYVSVLNEGPRIPEDQKENIWKSFSKLDKSRTRRKGSGLGLAINRGIIDAHGGEIGFLNRENGVEFYFTIPKVQPKIEETESKGSPQ
ncbi:sensor histidine kinase [Guggenheimella bovis]